ncbi:MAG: NADH-quinone oxidoreductase subunit NuoE [Actinobacteria bacterium]|nr:NADH-quinone oxidoreductase subunit NuoE [Actinomycetota bacterium]
MPEAPLRQPPDEAQIEQIIARHRGQRWALIPLLQEIQEAFGYIPPESIRPVAGALGLFPAQVEGVISFYSQLHTEPRGKKVVTVCRGTACHVRGGQTILKLAKQQLGVEEGETTPDLEYTLETVACIGVCALAPNMTVGTTTYGSLNPAKVRRILGSPKEADSKEAASNEGTTGEGNGGA